jgi:hypothetical protein
MAAAAIHFIESLAALDHGRIFGRAFLSGDEATGALGWDLRRRQSGHQHECANES